MKRVFLVLGVLILSIASAFAQYPAIKSYNTGSSRVCTPAQLNYLQSQYDKIVNELKSENPYNQAVTAATPTGYTVDPDKLANLRRIDRNAAAAVAMGLASPLPSAAQEYLDNQQLAYEAYVAQANGMPYNDYMKMQQMNYNSMYQVRMQQLRNYQELINQCLKNMRYQSPQNNYSNPNNYFGY